MTQASLAPLGSGRLFGTRTDVATQTPIEFGVLQEVTWDFNFATKDLIGSNQFPIFVGRTEAKWTGKAKSAVFSGALLNEIFFGQTLVSGQTQLQASEAHTVPSSPFTVTVTPPGSGTWAADEGVIYAATGLPLTLVASGPTQGQYSVSAGVYTFASSDNAAAVQINYTYAMTGSGQKLALTNQLIGTTPYFSVVYRQRDPRSGIFTTWAFNRCTSNKLTMAAKTTDFMIPEFDFEIMDDGTGNIGLLTFGDQS